ncbi:MAG TPA: ATP-binding protein, partial [Noviherbaspirillum sp.]|nr:ATP-binding protein [Noviherbaspirillum sp.]
MTFPAFSFNSLRGRLLLLVAFAIMPSVLMTVYTGWKERQHAFRMAQENLQRLTNLAAVNESESLRAARQLLIGLANTPELLASDEQCAALLQATHKRNPGYANLGLIQMNGDVTCSAVPSQRPVNLADRDHFQRAISERRFIAGNYIFGRVIQQHTINLTYPVIREDGQVAAVVFAAMTLPELDKFIQGINLPRGSVLITVDSQGNIISRRPAPEQWFGKRVPDALWDAITRPERRPQIVRGPDGVGRLHAFSRVGSRDLSDYTVTIGLPVDDIVASAWRDQLLVWSVLALITILTLFATWVVGNNMIVARVRKLAATAQDLASGKLDARTGIPHRNEEISSLAHALDDMAEALQRKEAERDRAEEELRAADRRKDEFLAMLAHELRNPLAPIRTAADVLRFSQGDPERVRHTSEIIARQVDHMTGLVDDLLDVSRVTRGLVSLNRETLDLRGVIAGAIEQSRSLIQDQAHTFTVDTPEEAAWVRGDRLRLIQVVTNLLNNAAKYTPRQGRIHLWIKGMDGDWAVGVRDNGVGISKELLPHIFELFSQAERTPDRSQGGLGLGLALVKSLVELHGGSISVR